MPITARRIRPFGISDMLPMSSRKSSVPAGFVPAALWTYAAGVEVTQFTFPAEGLM
jgi:hypothetical protein